MNQRYREFVMCIAQIEKNIEKIKAYEMKPYGLSGMDVTIFAQLSLKEEGYSVSELSKECEMDKAAISRSIKKLDEKGLVLYTKGYGSKITLTEEGKAIAKALLDKIDMYIAKAEETCLFSAKVIISLINFSYNLSTKSSSKITC